MANPVEVFDYMNEATLRTIVARELPQVPLEKARKKVLVENLSDAVADIGIKQITLQLKKAQLQELTDPLDIDHSGNNPNSAVVLQKRLYEAIKNAGAEEFLSELKTEQVKYIIEVGGETPVSNKKEELVDQAVQIINYSGMFSLLNRFDTPFVRNLLAEVDVKCASDSKAKIIHAIVTQSNVAKGPAPQKPAHKLASKKPVLKAGVHYEDVFQWYFHDELKDFCADNELKVSGSKPELIRRILAWLDGDKENTLPGAKKSPRKKSAETKKRELAAKKKAETKEKEKNTKTKKSVAKPKKPEPVEEEEVEEDEVEEVEQEQPVEKAKPKKGSKGKKSVVEEVEEEDDE